MSDVTQIALRHPDRIYVGGAWIEPAGTGGFDVLEGTEGRRVARVAEANEADVGHAVAAARSAFDAGPWTRMAPAERADYLDRIADEVEKRGAEFARIWSLESGVTFKIASERVGASMAGTFRYYAELGRRFAFREDHAPRAGGFGYLVREPVGVVGAIIPWNAPAGLMTTKTAPALVAGCTLVVKASPEAPCSAYLLAEICDKIGLPAGVFNMLAADRAASEALVRHPDVDKITFTGSTAAGRRIAALCGERVARCTLELGGKSAALILDDYDVGEAAAAIARSATYLTGQVCHSLTRLIIDKARHDKFVEALASEFAKVSVGDPFDPATDMGPLASAHHRGRVESYIESARHDGAVLAAGGSRPAGLAGGYFIEPTVFARVDNRSTIAREEIFGPVLSVIAADGEDDAVSIANDSPFGLNASVFTKDAERSYGIARRLRSGTVSQNGGGIDFSIAFGGFKQSGIGREGGVEGLLPFLETKTLLLHGAAPA